MTWWHVLLQTLDSERRKALEASKSAAAALTREQARVNTLEGERATLERKLVDERVSTGTSTWRQRHIIVLYCTHANPLIILSQAQEAKSKLQRHLASAQKAASDARNDLTKSETSRAEQEQRLEAASAQVASMRAELVALNARLAARDQQLLKHVEVRLVLAAALPSLHHRHHFLEGLRGSTPCTH